jgi:hypothetical protein
VVGQRRRRARHHDQVGPVSTVLARVLGEHDVGADEEADAERTGGNDLEAALAPLVPGGLPVAGGVGDVLLRVGRLDAAVGRPDEALVAAPAVELDRTAPDHDGHAQLVERRDAGLVVRERLLPGLRIEPVPGCEPGAERKLVQHEEIGTCALQVPDQHLPAIRSRAELRVHLPYGDSLDRHGIELLTARGRSARPGRPRPV